MLSLSLRLAPLALALAAPSALAAPIAGEHGVVRWFEGSFDEAVAKAKSEDKLIFIDFWTDWCGWCKRLDKDTFSQDSVASELGDVICLSIDAESETGAPLAKRFAVQGFPALILVNGEGQAQDSIGGYLPPKAFITEIQRVKRKEGTVDGLEAAVAADDNDLEARFQLAQKLQQLGDGAGFETQLAEIRKRDPEGSSAPLRTLAFQELLGAKAQAFSETGEFDDAALHAFLNDEKHASVRFMGWATLGMRVYPQLRRQKDAIAAVRKAWADCPEAQRAEVGGQVAWVIVSAGDDAGNEDHAFALEVAKAATQADPSNANLLDTLAQCLMLNGKKDEAIAAIDRAIALEPDNKNWKMTRQKIQNES